jgi:predicted nucleic acid-binding protein
MTRYLLDTNIIVRACDPNSPGYPLVINFVNEIIREGGECFVTPQVLIEFWVVATRPLEVNGLGWTTQKTRQEIDRILHQFALLEDTPDIFPLWFQLVAEYDIKGKRTHDIRLLAVMKAHKVTHLLTFNPDDFIILPELAIVQPRDSGSR